jgi:acrylyl-CoA reductase (NADPH)
MASRARVSADALVRRPAGLDAHRAMALGTAGFTAQLCVDALTHGGVTPDDGPVLVTGATGGVGSLAVLLLAQAGFEVEAATGSAGDGATDELLEGLGAARAITREEVSGAAGRALAGGRWAGVVDVAGGATLAGALAQTRTHGVVAACGLADDMALTTTVMPFIIRGVVLAGIDSALHPMSARPSVWQRLHDAVDTDALARLTTTVALSDVPARAAELLDRGVRGRTVVDLAA